MKRVSRLQLGELRGRLSPRDEEILRVLRRVRVATAAQIAALCFDGTEAARLRMARRTLRALVERRLLAELPYRPGGVRAGAKAAIFALDVVGLRLTDPADRPYRSVRRPWTTTPVFLDHHLAVTQLYVEVLESHRRGESELVTFDTEPACWRQFTARDGRRQTLRPDAYLVVGVGDYEHHWFIELDRDTEAAGALTRKLLAIRDHFERPWASVRDGEPVEPRTLFVVPSAKRQAQVRHLAAKVFGAELPELVCVATRDHVLAALLGPP